MNFTPFLMNPSGAVPTFSMNSAVVSLRCWRGFLWTPLELV